MLTKKFNIYLSNFKLISILWSKYIREKILLFEENCQKSKLLALEQESLSIKNSLLSLEIDTNELSDEELNSLNSKKLELNNKLLEVQETILYYNKLYKDLFNMLPLVSYRDLLHKYIHIFQKFDYQSDFLQFVKLSKKNINIDTTLRFTSNLIKFISYQKISTLFLFYMESLKQLDKDYLFVSKKKKKKRRTKRIFRKIKVIRKLKRFLFFKKKKKFISMIYFNFIKIFKKCKTTKSNLLLKKIPLSNRVVLKSNVEFFYKLHKNTKRNFSEFTNTNSYDSLGIPSKFKIYLRNFHQKPYWKLRKARITHWFLFYTKTLRKQRYKAFINKFVKHYENLNYNYSFFFNFFVKTYISWTRFSKLESFFKSIVVDKKHNIIKLPFFFKNIFKWTSIKKKNYIMRKKVGRWSFLNYKRSQFPWLQKKQNSPKNINHLQPNRLVLMGGCGWDVLTNIVYLNKEVAKFTFPTKDNFKVNWQVKLHMYRYKSNKICFLL